MLVTCSIKNTLFFAIVSSDGIKKPVPSFKTPPAGSHIS
nr:MAG TPA: hypothetical protein [Caudoviricetes sp.]